MKTKTITSILTITCVLCASAAFAAPSVRTLGGAGTYSGTTSAIAAKASGTTSTGATSTGSTRAGSIRVSPSTRVGGATTTSGIKATTSASNTGDQRMSIGKYLNGSSFTGGTKAISSGSTSTSAVDDLSTRVGELEGRVADVEDMSDDFITMSDVDGVFLTPAVAAATYAPLAAGDNAYVTQSELTELELKISALQELVGETGVGAQVESYVSDKKYVSYKDVPVGDGMYVMNKTSTGAAWQKVGDFATEFKADGFFE